LDSVESSAILFESRISEHSLEITLVMDGIKELIAKVSSYNIFNYILPGILFVIFCKYGLSLDLIVENNFLGAFLYYFIGMVVSRFGSVFIEPLLKKIKFLKFEDYGNYVKASKQDVKVELLSEVNNTYRTIVAMFSLLGLMKIYKHLNASCWHIPHEWSYPILLMCLLLLFLFSYRKQTKYINKRVVANQTP
jgi:hypothetical protein